MAELRRLYDQDFVAWSKQQAEALRTAARSGSNQSLDWENLAEEIEDLGKSARRELHSQIRRIVGHLLKLRALAGEGTAPRLGRIDQSTPGAEIEDLLEDQSEPGSWAGSRC